MTVSVPKPPSPGGWPKTAPSPSAPPQLDPNSGLFTPQTMLDMGRGGDADEG
jgi:hypothetical protein